MALLQNTRQTEPMAAQGLLIGAGLLLVGIALFMRRSSSARVVGAVPFAPVLNPMQLRSDVGGSGRFGASRSGHVHQGTDFRCRQGQPVYAPFDGRVTRIAYPYAGEPAWTGCVIESADDGYECKLFYMTPDWVGQSVQRGQVIGFAQAISRRYPSAGVTDHLHVELRQQGTLLNPETFFAFV